MNITETIALLRKVKAHCPSQVMDEYTPEAWAEVLDDIRWVDANQALINICKMDLDPGKSRYIEPGHIRGEVGRIRRRRLDKYGSIEAPPIERDPGEDWWSPRLRIIENRYMSQMRQLIADGEIEPGDTIPIPVVTHEEAAEIEQQLRTEREKRLPPWQRAEISA